jgi:hypothetical protein
MSGNRFSLPLPLRYGLADIRNMLTGAWAKVVYRARETFQPTSS